MFPQYRAIDERVEQFVSLIWMACPIFFILNINKQNVRYF